MKNRIDSEKIIEFFKVLDSILESPCKVYITGGGAAALAYASENRVTKDIDVIACIPGWDVIKHYFEKTEKMLGLKKGTVNIQASAFIDELDPEFKNRANRLAFDFKNLELNLLCKADFYKT